MLPSPRRYRADDASKPMPRIYIAPRAGLLKKTYDKTEEIAGIVAAALMRRVRVASSANR